MAHADAHHDDDHGHAVADGDDLPHHGPVVAEPRSPAWLPFLGVALFAVCGLWWLSTPNEDDEAKAAAAAAASASASAPAEEAPAGANAPPPNPKAEIHAPPKTPPPIPPGFKAAPTMTLNPAFKPR